MDPSFWQKAQDYAGEFEEIIDAPVIDAAAVIGVEAAWLGGMLFALKILSSGFWLEFERREH